MAIQWAPDFSTFTTDPNAVWRTTTDWETRTPVSGFYRQIANLDPYDSSGPRYEAIEAPVNPAQALLSSGNWNLNDQSIQRYLDHLAYTDFGGQATADWRNSPAALATLLGRLGATTQQMTDAQRAFTGEVDPTSLFGGTLSPEQLQAAEQSRKLQQHEANKTNSGGLSGITEAAGDWWSGANDFIVPAALTAIGMNYLGGTGAAGEAAGSASAGGTAAAGAGAGEAASLVGPATGAVEAAPVIGTAGAPTLSAVASGGGPFVPVISGAAGVSNAISGLLDNASGGASAPLAPGAGGAPQTTLERLLAAGLPALLGYLGADQQSDALGALADRQFAVGAPSRERFEASFAPGFDVANLPGLKNSMDVATDTVLRRLSAKGGNPFGNPGGLTEAINYVTGNVALPALNEYRRLNAGTGGLAALTAGAPQTEASAIGADANKYNVIGAGMADYFYPPKRISLADLTRGGLS